MKHGVDVMDNITKTRISPEGVSLSIMKKEEKFVDPATMTQKIK